MCQQSSIARSWCARSAAGRCRCQLDRQIGTHHCKLRRKPAWRITPARRLMVEHVPLVAGSPVAGSDHMTHMHAVQHQGDCGPPLAVRELLGSCPPQVLRPSTRLRTLQAISAWMCTLIAPHSRAGSLAARGSTRVTQSAAAARCVTRILSSRYKERLTVFFGMASNSAGRGRASVSQLDGQAPDGQDFANYFCTYAYLYHQVCVAGGLAAGHCWVLAWHHITFARGWQGARAGAGTNYKSRG